VVALIPTYIETAGDVESKCVIALAHAAKWPINGFNDRVCHEPRHLSNREPSESGQRERRTAMRIW
jgi:hypothetical protein